MLATNTKGTAWVDDLSNPGLAVIHGGACVFVSGDPNRLETRETLSSLLVGEAGDRGFLKILCTPDDGRWDGVEIVPNRFEGDVERRIYPRIEAGDRVVTDVLPGESELRQIDRALLLSDRIHLESMRDETTGGWGTEEAFLRRGFGFAVVGESAVLCWCTGE